MATSQDSALIAVIGGTGVYNISELENVRQIEIDTPFGKPSSKITLGNLCGYPVAFIARHDVGHRLSPSEIPFRANIYALKTLGVKYLLSFGACGSLKEEAKPLDIVLPNQFIDRTKSRANSFFGEGIIAHVSMADPVCEKFNDVLYEVAKSCNLPGASIHQGGTYICIEGPSFSTKAESNMYRMFGGTVIGMTGLPEAILAREAEIAYGLIALVTDYDCWHPDHDSVTVEAVMKVLKANSQAAQSLVREVIRKVGQLQFESKAHNALATSILTPIDKVPEATKTKLGPILEKYLNVKANH